MAEPQLGLMNILYRVESRLHRSLIEGVGEDVGVNDRLKHRNERWEMTRG